MSTETKRNQKAVLVDISRCIGCGSCTVACKMWNRLDFNNPQTGEPIVAHGVGVDMDGSTWTVVNHTEVERDGQNVWRFSKHQCMHCHEPGCASSCFSNAFKITEQGAVEYNPELCVGCRYCMLACPFDVPKYEWHKVLPSVMKCSFCSTKLESGEAPACVSVCPTSCLMFGDRDTLMAQAKATIANDPNRYVDHVYGEKEAGGTNWFYISDVPFADLEFKMDVPHRAVPAYVHDFTKFTPAIFIGGAALWTGVHLYTKRRHDVAKSAEQDHQK